MISQAELIRMFHRVLMEAKNTYPFQDLKNEVQEVIKRLVDRKDIDLVGLICHFESENEWLLVTLDELFWRQGEEKTH